ncbi:MAG: peroxidase-related enzyme [Proteobacteria bacterium]|nr:peroxidase-related enzyme [Pseudomonadota bacterium]
MTYLKTLGSDSSLLEVFKAFPGTSEPLIKFHEVLLRGSSPFTEAERELIAVHVSYLNGCMYCYGVHAAMAYRLGIASEALEQLAQDVDAGPVPQKMKPVLRYAERLTRDPDGVRESDVEAILAEGWNEVAIYHTVAVTALFNFMNRLVEGLGIELDPGDLPVAAKRLAEQGYLPLIELIHK